MPLRIENHLCYFTLDVDGQEQSLPATRVKILTMTKPCPMWSWRASGSISLKPKPTR